MPAAGRKPTRAKQLGVTDDEYARLLAAQDGHCAICPTTPKTRRLDADHNHQTGLVRGLLCHRCNRALPNWITPVWLRRAAEYLERGEPRCADFPDVGVLAATRLELALRAILDDDEAVDAAVLVLQLGWRLP